ncbi:MAG: hypothetical protein ACJ8H8_23250 [Geminicoccaceae bacterium]
MCIGLIGAAILVAMPPAHAEQPVGAELKPAALPVPLPVPATPGPVIQVQTQTCGCTAPPSPKQKIMTNNNGKLSCTVTTMACWAP